MSFKIKKKQLHYWIEIRKWGFKTHPRYNGSSVITWNKQPKPIFRVHFAI